MNKMSIETLNFFQKTVPIAPLKLQVCVCCMHFTVNYAQILQELRLLNLSLSYILVILIYYNILVHCIVAV